MFLNLGSRPQFWSRAFALAVAAIPSTSTEVFGVEADQILSFNPGKFIIQPQFDFSTQFTDNLFYAAQGSEASSTIFNPALESDVLWYLSPGLEVQYGRNPENSIKVSGFYDQILYTKNSDFNSDQQRFAVETRLEFGRFVLKGNDNISWLDTILGGSTAVQDRTPIRQFIWYDNYRLTYDATMKTDFYLGVNHNQTDYLQTVNLYDQNTVLGTLGATYKPTERIDVFVEGEGGHTTLAPNAPFQAPVNPSNIYGGFVGASGTFTSRLDGEIKVGYETRDFPGATVQTANTGSPAVVMGLTYTQSARRIYNLSYERRVGVSSQVPDQSYIFDLVYLTFTQGIGTSGRWLLQVRGGVALGDYSDRITYLGGVIPINNARTDQTYTASVTMSYQPNAWLTASAAYQFEKYTAEFPDQLAFDISGLNDFHVNRIVLRVSIGY